MTHLTVEWVDSVYMVYIQISVFSVSFINLMALIDKWVRVFDISETSKHIKGFTLYKIVSIVYPKSCPDAVTKVTVWKRYNDFKNLHHELKLKHKSLQIEDKFPVIPNTSYFKRFDTGVINQRKNNILLFLEYVALHPSLFKSTEFVKFFETSHTPQESLNSNINIIRAQLNLPNEPEITYPCNSEDDYSDSESVFSFASSSFLHLDEPLVPEILNVNQVESPDIGSNKSLRNCFPTPPSTPDTVASLDQNCTQYLTVAAEYITKAAEFEEEKKYEESFAAYKNGIANLLDGVKGDKDSHRRQMVRHKVEKYLLRAEKIYNLHLSPEITQLKHIFQNENDINIYNIKRPIEDLFNYKVLKSMDSGMVVLHRKEHNVFYLKVIQKSPYMSDKIYLNIPKDVPYMVKLFQYYDSTNAIFIVTQYVSGGKLFDHINQKSVSVDNDTIAKSITFEKEISQLANGEFDESSESSECSYSELITDYTTKKSFLSNTATNNEKCSDTEEGSSLTSHASDHERRETSESNSSDSLLSKSQNNQKTFHVNEKSIIENMINYIPPVEDVIRWSAQLLLAIDKLHKVGTLICDLNPRNLLLDEKGNLLLTFTCNIREKRKIFCNKSENYYCAPEVYGLENITFAADWWSFGAILFELLTGMPLKSVHPEGIHNYTILKIPKYVCPEGKSILRQLLVYEPLERLGCGVNGIDELKSHPFFSTIDWIRLQVDAFKT